MVKLSAKRAFFDTKRVLKAIGRAQRDVLVTVGAFIRTSAVRSIKKAPFVHRKPRGKRRRKFERKTSKPGDPPFSQVGTLKRFLRFEYDFSTQSVVVGPEKVPNKPGTAPRTLEKGGAVTIRLKSRRLHRKGSPRVSKPAVRAMMKPRPYMLPALEKNLNIIPNLWKNSVKGP